MSKEFIVRVPREVKKQFHVMRFNSSPNIDIAKFKQCKMERESLIKEVKEENSEEPPEFGAGSEFGRKEKEEARKRRFQRRKHKQSNSPWVLKVCGKNGKKYKGIREGGVTENTSYYVFFQAPDGAFEAFPVNEWYNFTPFQRYNTMSLEEAEEKFTKRDRILNYFTLKSGMNKGKEGEEEGGSSTKKAGKSVKKEFKVSDMDDWYDSENEMKYESDSDDDVKPKTKNAKDKKAKKKKKDSDDDNDEEPLEESDEGDYDDKEVDYMSDSSSSDDDDEKETKDELKGVEDESALRDLVVSEEEDEEEEQNKEDNEQQSEGDKVDGDKKIKIKTEKNGDESGSSSDFDSDDSDYESSKAALFMFPKKGSKSKPETSEKDGATSLTSVATSNESKVEAKTEAKAVASTSSSSSSSAPQNGLKLKHKLDNPISPHASKKQKTSNESTHGITEDAVRRYLLRKPMTTRDILHKFKNRVPNCEGFAEIVARILKKINPEKQMIQGKTYFYLKPK